MVRQQAHHERETSLSNLVVCMTSFAKMRHAEKCAAELIAQKLAACVQVLPKMKSFYEWDGALQKESEVLMLIKTTADLTEQIQVFFQKHHPYEVPEFIVLSVSEASEKYLEWVNQVTV